MTQTPSLREERLRAERDLYLHLLGLAELANAEQVLRRAAELAKAAAGCPTVYVAAQAAGDQQPRWWALTGSEDAMAGIRERLSTTVVRRAMALGEPVMVEHPMADPELVTKTSIRVGAQGPLMCVPIGHPVPMGVLYLQRDAHQAAFTLREQRMAHRVASSLVAALWRFLHEAGPSEDPTARHRAHLRGHEVLIGRSTALARVLRQVRLTANDTLPVLITGETGTGKSLCAQVVHDNGGRRGQFVQLSAANFQDGTFDAAMFGTRRGDFTGAIRRRGFVPQADGGSLFLDEVDSLSPRAQQKLLRVLQDGAFEVGGASMQADVRWIVGTNRDLDEEVASGRFRRDLHQRLAGFTIEMPPLSERLGDIPALVDALLEARPLRPTASAMSALMQHDWPGNVRELGMVIRRAHAEAVLDDAAHIGVAHVFPDATRVQTLDGFVREATKGFLERTLAELDWDVDAAAARLDVGRATLYRRMASVGIRRPKRMI